MNQLPDIKIIYSGGYTWPLGICRTGRFAGWLMGQHPDGQWVSLAKPDSFGAPASVGQDDDLTRRLNEAESLLRLIAEALARGDTIPKLAPLLITAKLTDEDRAWARDVISKRGAA